MATDNQSADAPHADNRRLAAIQVNFDSIWQATGFAKPRNLDPAFTKALPRFLEYSDRLKFKYTFFIVGRDLERDENRDSVKALADAGHEIGNHSWSHLDSLSCFNREETLDEIKRSHDVIAEVIGTEPKGFIAPGWGISPNVIETLINLGYEYDTSVMPSFMMIPTYLKILWSHIGSPKFLAKARRRYISLWLNGPRFPFMSSGNIRPVRSQQTQDDNLCILPLPTNRFRMPCWHTVPFFLGWDRHLRILDSCLEEHDLFYYLLHPLDLLDLDDLDKRDHHSQERAATPLPVKREYFENSLKRISDSGHRFVTMHELAKAAKRSLQRRSA